MSFELRPEQQRTVDWMVGREGDDPGARGGILADDVGAGKTFAVVGLMRQSPLWPALVVVPKSLVWQWIRTLQMGGLTDVCAVTSRSAAAAERSLSCEGVVLVTLGVMVSASDPPAALADRAWGRVVVDEAHCAKNPRSRTNRVLRSLIAHARWAVTADPVQNHEGDLLAIARVVGVEADGDVALARSFVRYR